MTFLPISDDVPYSLRYAYTTWLKSDIAPHVMQAAIEQTQLLLQSDQLKILEHRVKNQQIQLLLSAKPTHAPVDLARLTKGKLSFALSQQEIYKPFRREFGLRAVGENTTQDLEHYLQQQISQRGYADERFAESLKPFSRQYDIDMNACVATTYGNYWYDLHLVLVTQDRYGVVEPKIWELLIQETEGWHREQLHQLRSVALLPDHLHLLIRPNIHRSPYEVGSGLIGRLNRIRAMQNLYGEKFYVATHGLYPMAAIRNLQRAAK